MINTINLDSVIILANRCTDMIGANDDTQQAFWREMETLRCERDDAIRQWILEDKVLDLCTWTLNVRRDNSSITLTAEEDSGDPKLKDLAKYTENDFHSSFKLVVEDRQNNFGASYKQAIATLAFSDGDIFIHFDNNSDIPPFVQKFGLKVNTANVDQEIDKLKTSISALETLKSLVV